MTREKFLKEMDVLLELEPGTLTGSEALKDLDLWDSMKSLEFVLMVEQKGGGVINGGAIANAKTVSDLFDIVQSSPGAGGEARP